MDNENEDMPMDTVERLAAALCKGLLKDTKCSPSDILEIASEMELLVLFSTIKAHVKDGKPVEEVLQHMHTAMDHAHDSGKKKLALMTCALNISKEERIPQ